MLVRCVRASRPMLANLSRQQISITTRRTLFAPSAIRSADLVQEMYLRELKNFKPTPVQPNDSEGHVHKFSIPKPPTSPEESNIANELKDYEAQSPEIEGQVASDGTPAVEEDWFEEEEEEGASAAH